MTITRALILSSTTVALVMLGDSPRDARAPLGIQLVPEAHAVFGVWRRHARRWAVVGTAAVAGSAAAASSAEASSQAAAAQQPAAPPPPAGSDKPLPIGTVVHSLPHDCTPTPVGGVQYEYCGGNFYRTAFQGNDLIYVTAKP